MEDLLLWGGGALLGGAMVWGMGALVGGAGVP